MGQPIRCAEKSEWLFEIIYNFSFSVTCKSQTRKGALVYWGNQSISACLVKKKTNKNFLIIGHLIIGLSVLVRVCNIGAYS